MPPRLLNHFTRPRPAPPTRAKALAVCFRLMVEALDRVGEPARLNTRLTSPSGVRPGETASQDREYDSPR